MRVSAATHRKVKELAARRGTSMQEVVEEAVEQLRRQRFLEEANQAFAALRANPEAWAEEQEERALWEVTLADGLENE
jgi:hypothetical protein